MGNINTVGPNEALIISGGWFGSTGKKMIVGGYGWSWWLVSDVQRLSLEIMTLTPHCIAVETCEGVPLTVTGVAQCKIMNRKEFLSIAAEQFLGETQAHIKSVILQTLEGHLRAILGTLTVEEIYKDRDQFAHLVREMATPDVAKMGIDILSFTIKEVFDQVEYLSSLGRAQVAVVKRDANIGVAQAERDAGIQEAECEKSAMDVKYTTGAKIQDSSRMCLLLKAQYDSEVNSKKAEAELAYELESARLQQQIRNEEMEINVVERRKQIAIQDKEILRKELELKALVKSPAEAESYKVEMVAQGQRTQTVEVAKGEAQRIRMIGGAEAYAIEAIGKAEAERMRMKAAAYKLYGEAAILSLTLDALPKIAAEVAAPLSRTQNIVMLGGSTGATGEIARLIGQIPPTVEALTGIDLSKVLAKIPGAVQ